MLGVLQFATKDKVHRTNACNKKRYRQTSSTSGRGSHRRTASTPAPLHIYIYNYSPTWRRPGGELGNCLEEGRRRILWIFKIHSTPHRCSLLLHGGLSQSRCCEHVVNGIPQILKRSRCLRDDAAF